MEGIKNQYKCIKIITEEHIKSRIKFLANHFFDNNYIIKILYFLTISYIFMVECFYLEFPTVKLYKT